MAQPQIAISSYAPGLKNNTTSLKKCSTGTNNLTSYKNKFCTNLLSGRLNEQHISAGKRKDVDVEFKAMHSLPHKESLAV